MAMVEGLREGDIPGVQLRCRRLFAGVSAAELWPWVSEAPRLAQWLADEAVVEPEAVGFELHSGEIVEYGRTVEQVPMRRWVLDLKRPEWATATRLCITLAEHRAGCELTVDERNFHGLPLSDCLTVWEWSRHRWRQALETLAKRCERPGR